MSAIEVPEAVPTFAALGLRPELCTIVKDLGYEVPTPIQSRSIPILLSGRDLIGQAQTGTGKTAAFALPLLSKIDLKRAETQVLVLTPTRELAIQVAEAFKSYARQEKKFHVLPIYGGQSIVQQFRQLERRPHVVVGTPGRVMDHLRRGTLSLDRVTALVMDEADEMLSMGFLEDIQWIIEQTPSSKQTTLFSATMPRPIRAIAQKYLKDPEEVIIKQVASEAALINQSHWLISGIHKLDALTRVLEVSETDGVLIFVRTKTATAELAEKLEARGYSAGALNGDMSQDARERMVSRFKQGKLDILVATDVAARGLHVDRISHVVNFDVPFDAETYTHRIGRTGRAGRAGTAILFVSPREMGLLRIIERSTGKRIPPLAVPTREDLTNRRIDRFVERVTAALEHKELIPYGKILETVVERTQAPVEKVAAALAAILNEETPLFIKEADVPAPPQSSRGPKGEGRERHSERRTGRDDRAPRDRKFSKDRPNWKRKGPPKGKKAR